MRWFIGVKADPGDACTGQAGVRDDDEALFRDPILPVNIPTLDLQEVCTRLFWFPIPDRADPTVRQWTPCRRRQPVREDVLG